jgi:hypothetical protein
VRRASALLAVAAAALAAGQTPALAQTDREDPVPASTGPGNVRGFYVNPSTPAGVDPARWLALAQRVLARWGDTYLGQTNASPSSHTDRQSTIGFSASLGASFLGLTSGNDFATTQTLPRVDQCTTLDVPGTDDAATTTVTHKRFRMRRDLIKKGRVRKRTITRSAERRSETVTRTPLRGRQCVTGDDVDVARLQNRELDIELGTNPTPYTWDAGPAHPTSSQVDLEETLLHEIGHAHGLAHQLPQCDLTTPMRASLPSGSWWRAQDEASWTDCPSTSMFSGDTPPDPGPPPATPLAGITVFANPTLAAGLDPERFGQVVQSVVTRLGGTYGGTTTSAPGDPDGVSVVGLGSVFGNGLAETDEIPLSTELTVSAHLTCTQERRAFTILVPKRTSVRRRLGGRLVRLRRDHFVKSKHERITFDCNPQPAVTTVVGTGNEVDVRINDRYAYEFGPSHPVIGTRYDLETAVLSGLLDATGSPRSSDVCSTTTPVAPLMPGDWWRGPGDVSRAQCHRSDQAVPAQVVTAGPPRVRRVLTVIR